MLAGTDPADIRLVDVGVDLHLGQVGGDDEERRRLHARGDRLADVDAALNDDAVDRRFDHGVREVDLVLVDRRLRLADGGLGLRHGGLLRLQTGLRRVDGDLRAIELALRAAAVLPASSLARANFCCASVSWTFGALELAQRLG
jgi:hypothetical protein